MLNQLKEEPCALCWKSVDARCPARAIALAKACMAFSLQRIANGTKKSQRRDCQPGNLPFISCVTDSGRG